MPFDPAPSLVRTFDAEQVNEWIWRDSGKRHPAMDQILADRHNVFLAKGEGGALFVWRGPGIYEVHVAFEQRGKDVLALSRLMLAWMRENMGARLFWAAVPVESRHVIIFTRLMGWKSQGCDDLSHGRCELFIGE
jgi:hypothetical protein